MIGMTGMRSAKVPSERYCITWTEFVDLRVASVVAVFECVAATLKRVYGIAQKRSQYGIWLLTASFKVLYSSLERVLD